MRLTLLLVVFLRSLVGQEVNVRIDTERSFVAYTGKHLFHSWTGTSRSINTHFTLNRQDPTLSSISLKIPVISFDSKNSNRDSDMLYAVDEYQYPQVVFNSTTIERTPKRDEYMAKGPLIFHGISKEIAVLARVSSGDKEIIVKSNFTISLDDFAVERPSLLLIPIEESIIIDVFIVGELD